MKARGLSITIFAIFLLGLGISCDRVGGELETSWDESDMVSVAVSFSVDDELFGAMPVGVAHLGSVSDLGEGEGDGKGDGDGESEGEGDGDGESKGEGDGEVEIEGASNNGAGGGAFVVVGGIVGGGLGSRSIANPGGDTDEGTAARYTPRDVWVIQYAGTTDQAPLSGLPVYVELSGLAKVQAVASSTENTLVFVANTHDATLDFGDISTLGQMKRSCMEIEKESDCVGNNFSSHNDLILSGKYEGVIVGGAISAELFRNIARLDFTLRNGVGSSMTLRSVQLCNVPKGLYYAAGMVRRDALFPTMLNYFDYPAELLSAAAIPGGVESFTFYMPANQRGVVMASTSTRSKADYAPSYSSYIRIMALDAENKAYVYRIYLGANMVNDYNISANNRLAVELTINAPGDATTDGRVDNYDQLDFESSNCYILNPSPNGSGARVFTIPIDKVNEFWKDHDPTLMIGLGDAWTAELIWQDISTPNLIGFIDPSNQDAPATNTFSGTGTRERIALIAKPGGEGNALIGIKKVGRESVGYLWSWHLWVTDYDPEYRAVPDPGQFVYSVPGGAVHRHAGPLWTEAAGLYHTKYIMDRNLGARNTLYTHAGAIYYQFGRKDPLPVSYGNTFYDIGGAEIPASDPRNPGTNNPAVLQGVTLATAVLNPTAYYCMTPTGNWAVDGTWGTNPWNDPLPGLGRKSIFDPCPWGWQLPAKNTWDDFKYNANPSLSTVAHPERDARLAWNYKGIIGLRYWPLGQEVSGDIFYPALGYRDNSNGAVTRLSICSPCWLYSAEGETHGTAFVGTSLNAGLSREARSVGFSVRCVQQ